MTAPSNEIGNEKVIPCALEHKSSLLGLPKFLSEKLVLKRKSSTQTKGRSTYKTRTSTNDRILSESYQGM